MNNPIAVARKYQYDKLVGSALLASYPIGDRTFKFFIYPDWPEQAARYPLAFIYYAVPRLVTPVGTTQIDDNGLWFVNLVGSQDWNISDLDPALNEVLDLLHHTLGPAGSGIVSGIKIEGIIPEPYRVGADLYPRYVIQTRVYAGGN